MTAYTLKRAAALVPVILGSVLVVFGLMRVIPGDTAAAYLGEQATPEAVAELREAMGLDRPLWIQFGTYVMELARGDLGFSLFRSYERARVEKSAALSAEQREALEKRGVLSP